GFDGVAEIIPRKLLTETVEDPRGVLSRNAQDLQVPSDRHLAEPVWHGHLERHAVTPRWMEVHVPLRIQESDPKDDRRSVTLSRCAEAHNEPDAPGRYILLIERRHDRRIEQRHRL